MTAPAGFARCKGRCAQGRDECPTPIACWSGPEEPATEIDTDDGFDAARGVIVLPLCVAALVLLFALVAALFGA